MSRECSAVQLNVPPVLGYRQPRTFRHRSRSGLRHNQVAPGCCFCVDPVAPFAAALERRYMVVCVFNYQLPTRHGVAVRATALICL